MKVNRKAWDKIFRDSGKVFKKPHGEISKIILKLKRKSARKILDFGCGTGRHVVYLAKNGFEVYGFDNSEEAIKQTRQWLKKEKLSANLKVHDMTKKLPFKGSLFDAVISVQVIHHAKLETIKKMIREIERILKKDGLLFITVPLYRGPITPSRKGKWKMKKIEEHTYVPLSGPEKGLIHYYFTPEKLKESLGNFKINKTYIDDTNHYCLLGFKK